MTTRPVVVGTDGSEHSLLAVEWAARAAERRKAALRVVSVVVVPPRSVWPRVLPDTVARTAGKETGHALALAIGRVARAAPGVLADGDVLWGPPASALVACAAGASLLVVGCRGAGGFASMLLGSVSRYVAMEAPCPVVVVRGQAADTRREVVVGVRDLDTSTATLAFAFEEAELRRASLRAVHAWFVPAYRHAGHVLDPRETAEKATAEMHAMLAGWREKYPGVQVTEEVVHEHPGHVLADLSARAELVVLGRHAGEALPGPRTGAVTHAVLSHAHGPVACVPAERSARG
jgi:nucleotide-binding universal stress UspA family protein